MFSVQPIRPGSGKQDFGGGSRFIPTAGGFGGDGGDVLDGNLPAKGLGRFDLDLSGVAGLLGDFLVRRRFVADVKQLGRFRGKVQDAGFFRDAGIDLVQDGATEGETF